MFGFWKRRPHPRLVRESDQVFMSRARADTALQTRALEGELPTIVASFFPASLERIQQSLAATGVQASQLSPRGRPALPLAEGAGPWLLDANHLMLDVNIWAWILQASATFRVLFVEHYPTTRPEAAALDVIEGISATRPQHVQFFVGLDEPLMAAFDSARMIGLLERLGMDPNEPISHPWVDKSIVNAQKKLEARVKSPQPVDSDVEWFRINGIRR